MAIKLYCTVSYKITTTKAFTLLTDPLDRTAQPLFHAHLTKLPTFANIPSD